MNQQSVFNDYDKNQNDPNEIIIDEQEIGNSVYQSIRNLLQIFIPI